MTIELETFYSGRLGSFWWDSGGEGGGVGAASLEPGVSPLPRWAPRCPLSAFPTVILQSDSS